jgi:DNA adenine methylase
MPATLTPLRYPGGKTKNYEYVKSILDMNHLHGTYIEPFAGGAGLAIKLLLNNDVERIVINDSDLAIYSFWKCVLDYTDELCDFIDQVPLTIEQWSIERDIYLHPEQHSVLELGKATFFLNRTNVSGVIKGGIIGGLDQSGKYKMDARFNRENLIKKIRRIADQKDRIEVLCYDVFEFMKSKELHHYYKAFINFDPPYVKKGGQLYMNFFKEEDHIRLRDAIRRSTRKWMVTYDVCDLIEDLYSDYRKGYMDLTYSANKTRKAQELVFFSNNLVLPE